MIAISSTKMWSAECKKCSIVCADMMCPGLLWGGVFWLCSGGCFRFFRGGFGCFFFGTTKKQDWYFILNKKNNIEEKITEFFLFNIIILQQLDYFYLH